MNNKFSKLYSKGRLASAFLCVASLFSTSTTQAEVRCTKFDPPLSVQWNSFGCIPIDIDLDGNRDFTFFATGNIRCFMEAHNAVVIQSPVLYPTGTDMDSDAAWMGALPFGTSIGKELSSTVELGGYSWSSGTVVSGEGPQIPEMGDHESILVGSGFSQTPGFILPRGDVSIPLPVHNPKGNILGKEGVLALQFSVPLSGEGTSDISSPRFGYVHFDFPNTDNPRTGTLRILGWAYETEADKPIVAKPLITPSMKIQFSIQKREDGGLELSWLATPGATYQAERSYHSEGPFEKVGEEIVPLPTSGAKPVQKKVIISKEEAQSSQTSFWRMVRLK
jgi:hypothetical protein